MEMDFTIFDIERRATDAEFKGLLLEMLLAFDSFCRKHGLRYYLSGGTLLGAVRHKGFIPWDDDIDVNMPRTDCEKLIKLSGGKIGKFRLEPPCNKKVTFAYHWKLYGDEILVAKRLLGRRQKIGKKIYPAFMDIFPIEGLPDDYEVAEQHYNDIRQIKRKARFQTFLTRYRGANPLKKVIRRLFQIYFRHFVLTNFHDAVIDFAKKYSFETSSYIGVMMTDVHGIVERVQKSEYLTTIELDFEGHRLRAPAGYHTYLTQLYGENYMSVLPPHRQFSRHELVPFKRKFSKLIDDDVIQGLNSSES